MLLHSLHGPTSVNSEAGVFKTDKNDKVEVPHDLGIYLRDTWVGGQKQFEDEIERQAREVAEKEAKRRDPASLLDAVEALAAAQEKPARAPRARKAPAPKPVAKKTPARRAPARKGS